ncbi:hypothetical protein DHEL01_v210832 [Diaporthe helianthi]|uniref:Uncharacterized protein n=1 Tax=Diaporthe helianthi TaxID=158607 RepID=A0A2P5HKI3_DIAHE|nr:hypothetical protein DHEL01_v210832 [Diaporthe helianthi]
MISNIEPDQATPRRHTVFQILYKSLVGKKDYGSFVSFGEHKGIITALTAILFDQECSIQGIVLRQIITAPDPAPLESLIAPPLSILTMSGQSGKRMLASLIEHMLLIDYGIVEQPLRPLHPELTWMTNYMTRVVYHGVSKRLVQLTNDCRNGKEIAFTRLAWMDELIRRYEDESSADDDFSDVGLMLYFFWTRRREITRDQYLARETGYTGVLNEMIREIPSVGKDRLIRKLSVDVKKLIPCYVRYRSTRAHLITKATWIARELGVDLRAPEYAFESLSRPGSITTGSSAQPVGEQGLSRNNGGASLEGDTASPPSYQEASLHDMP